MAIRWADFPHEEIFADIHSRMNKNAVERSADDSLQHILRRRLHFVVPEEHRKFIELESRHIVERLRCTRDAYRAFTNSQGCSPAAEAYWVILRFATLPTAIACLRQSVFDYVKLTRVRAADLSLLFGIPTRPCHHPNLRGDPGELKPGDRTPANDDEIEYLARTVIEHTLLLVEDDGVWRPFGDGPFALDDHDGIHRSWNLCAMWEGMTIPDWIPIRKQLWDVCIPWTGGLTALFGCVQDELLSQWLALPADGKAQEVKWKQQSPDLESVAVPDPTNEFVKDGAVWMVTFMGKTVKIPANMIGLDYISVILRAQGRPMSALEVQQLAGGNLSSSQVVENALDSLWEEKNEENDVSESASRPSLWQKDFTRDPILDDRARKECEAELLDLEQQVTLAIEAGDVKKAESLQTDTTRLSER